MQSTYAFRYTNNSKQHLHLIKTIGWETTDSPSYEFDGLNRTGNGLLFKYTLSGEGKLEVGDATYRIPKNHGFFVNIPGAHRYYYDSASGEPWEFIWIKLYELASSVYWEHFIRALGHVVEFKAESEPIKLLWKLYRDVDDNILGPNKHDTSIRVYEWLMSLHRYSEGEIYQIEQLPESIRLAKKHIETYYYMQLSLEQIAQVAQLSKTHFCKMFLKYVGATPIDYLRKKRIEEAAQFLKHTNIPVSQIALKTGFDNLNYFGKVFRKMVGITPTEFREEKSDLALDYLHILN
jgi:AraC-like DNA-binding protein